jgi:hypothetical protein
VTTPGKTPTPAQVQAFWTYMTEHFGSQILNKADATEMQIVSSLLGTLGILDPADFMRNYATTIGTRIYLPFTPGVVENGWELWDQVVVGAHENQHVVQASKLGLTTYGARYLFSASTRADFEAEAYRSMFELDWWHERSMPDPEEVAQLLAGYGCSSTDIDVAETMLREAAESVEHGAILNEASSVAIQWLNAHAPELRAS